MAAYQSAASSKAIPSLGQGALRYNAPGAALTATEPLSQHSAPVSTGPDEQWFHSVSSGLSNGGSGDTSPDDGSPSNYNRHNSGVAYSKRSASGRYSDMASNSNYGPNSLDGTSPSTYSSSAQTCTTTMNEIDPYECYKRSTTPDNSSIGDSYSMYNASVGLHEMSKATQRA
jgi:hypothetical protein